MKNYIFILAIILAGCSINNSNNSPEAVMLRVKNTGTIDFVNVTLAFSGEEVQFGALAAGQTSNYRSFDTAYKYGFIEIQTTGKVYHLVPTDYVGETPLKKGYYTYNVKIENNSISFEFDE